MCSGDGAACDLITCNCSCGNKVAGDGAADQPAGRYYPGKIAVVRPDAPTAGWHGAGATKAVQIADFRAYRATVEDVKRASRRTACAAVQAHDNAGMLPEIAPLKVSGAAIGEHGAPGQHLAKAWRDLAKRGRRTTDRTGRAGV